MRFILSICCFLLMPASLVCADASQASAPTSPVDSAQPTFDYDTALKFSQRAIGNLVDDLELTRADGTRVKLSQFHGKPLVLSMVYTSCYQICPMTTRHLSEVVQKARETLGDNSFAVAAIGFDTRFDTPTAMQYFANKQGISDEGWNLLSIDEKNLEVLSAQVGFQYFPSANGFDHLIQATIIDAEGKVYRQVYGQSFETPLLIDPLIELVLGRSPPGGTFLADLGSKIRLFCTTYDPVRDGYYFDYSLFLGMLIGGSIIIFIAVIVVRGLHNSA